MLMIKFLEFLSDNDSKIVSLTFIECSAQLCRRDWQNFIIIFGAASLGVSMHLIHIYVKPLKQFMQVTLVIHDIDFSIAA